MKVGIIGVGYVGLVQGVVLANFGLDVICMDKDKEKISKLKDGIIPIYEEGLSELLGKVSSKINFTTNIKEVVEKSEVIFIAVGTPAADDGKADLTYVLDVAHNIGMYINDYKVIVNKSTVPVGTAKMVRKIIQKQLILRQVNYEFDIVSNPEFLREGKAIKDCQLPNRIVIGTESDKAREIMKEVYRVLYLKETPFVFTNLETAELIKYASNSLLAVKISFINEMALLAEKLGANIQEVAKAMGMDGRISPKFLNAGPGYGGSCFPKDTKAIVQIAEENGEALYVVEAAIKANEKQKMKMVEKIIKTMNIEDGMNNKKKIGILGLSFKPETDDMREAPSLTIIRELVKKGIKIQAFCPQGMREARWRLSDINHLVDYCTSEYDVAEQADALVIMTEWNQFRGMDLKKLRKKMNKKAYLFDLRNIYVKNNEVRELFCYFPIGMK